MLETTRRKFFALVGGILAVPFVGKITDTKAVAAPTVSKEWSVQKFLNAKYLEYFKTHGKTPTTIIVSRGIFDDFESQIATMQRFVDSEGASCGYKVLAFKSCKLCWSSDLRYMDVLVGGNELYEAFIQRQGRWA